MADEAISHEHVDDEPEETPGYKAPKQVDLKTLTELDKDDESLVKYKQQLLGSTDIKPPYPDDKRNVIVAGMQMVVDGNPIVELDLQGDVSELKKNKVSIAEGITYTLKVTFYVQREIVAGLRYHHGVFRKGIRLDKSTYMMGSYGPKPEIHTFTSPTDEAPAGLISRGSYVVKSKFLDDDKNVILEWEWGFDIVKKKD